MKENNDIELASTACEVQALVAVMDKTMRDGSLSAVVTLASKIEDAARKLGWRAQELRK